MNQTPPPKPNRKNNLPKLLSYCLLFSFGLHVIIIIALTILQNEKEAELDLQDTPSITLVDRIPKTKQSRPAKYEIDQKPKKKPPQKPVDSFRKADFDQKVKQEQAPKGDDTRDQTAKQSRPVSMPESSPPAPKSTLKPEKTKTKAVDKNSIKVAPTPPKTNTHKSTPTLEQLMPNLKVLDQIARGNYGDRNRIKYRPDTEISDEVWLNLESDLLVSFFRRFHNQIDLVWNYPKQAAISGTEGTLLMLIIINRNGELLDVDVLKSSGSEILDFEAVQAVYRAAPFGPLTKHYPHDKLKIKAHFNYRLGGSAIYGQ